MKIQNFSFDNQSTFIIAELSCNHLHNLDLTLRTIEEIFTTGVDALKVQTLSPDLMTIKCDNEHFLIKNGTPWDKTYLYDLYTKTTLPWNWHIKIKNKCEELGLIFFSTPYGIGNDNINDPVDFLESLEVPCYKIASFEITDIPFIRRIAKLQKPIIMSTGIAEYEDIKLAVDICKEEGNNQLILLKCTSAYPTPLEDVNLKTMIKIKEDFKCLVGISDHTLCNEVAISSVALGGRVIEKHVTLDRNLGGPDALFSVEPKELKEMVDSVRKVEKLIGKPSYDLTDKQKISKQLFSRSIFVIKDIKKGELLSQDNIRSIRPGYGLHPKYYDKIIGKKAKKDIKYGEPLNLSLIEGY